MPWDHISSASKSAVQRSAYLAGTNAAGASIPISSFLRALPLPSGLAGLETRPNTPPPASVSRLSRGMRNLNTHLSSLVVDHLNHQSDSLELGRSLAPTWRKKKIGGTESIGHTGLAIQWRRSEWDRVFRSVVLYAVRAETPVIGDSSQVNVRRGFKQGFSLSRVNPPRTILYIL
jgi:hypothetical protein